MSVYGRHELKADDLPEFKRLLAKSIEDDDVFVHYHDRKYSVEYAIFAIRVLEKTDVAKHANVE